MLQRGPSPLSVAERELIAAYVSGLNACDYCHRIHTATAGAFGAAWHYPHPSPLARTIKNRVAFWNGVQVLARESAGRERGGR